MFHLVECLDLCIESRGRDVECGSLLNASDPRVGSYSKGDGKTISYEREKGHDDDNEWLLKTWSNIYLRMILILLASMNIFASLID